MALQRFHASDLDTMEWPNGAVGYRPGGHFDCLGPFAKVKNCPVHGSARRVTAYATGYADTFFSVPAVCQVRGKRVTGFLTCDEGGAVFHPYDRFRDLLS